MNSYRAPKYYDLCPHPGCTKRGDFCRGMCSRHYLVMRKHCIENGSWGNGAPLVSPIVVEHWQWFGDEDSLAALCEENERLRIEKEAREKTT
jgi:hypothetical protein